MRVSNLTDQIVQAVIQSNKHYAARIPDEVVRNLDVCNRCYTARHFCFGKRRIELPDLDAIRFSQRLDLVQKLNQLLNREISGQIGGGVSVE